jgi:hypothetical protein
MKKGGKDIEEEKEKDIQIKQARIHLIDLVVVRVTEGRLANSSRLPCRILCIQVLISDKELVISEIRHGSFVL